MAITKFVTYPELPDYGVPNYSRRHLIDLQRRGLFPKARQIGLNRIGWDEDEIRAHVASRPVARSVAQAPGEERPRAQAPDEDRPRAQVGFRRGQRATEVVTAE